VLKAPGAAGPGRAHREALAMRPATHVIRPHPTAAGGQSITCLICGLTSYHPQHVRDRFCGRRHRRQDP
jgi:hypothetical protein